MMINVKSFAVTNRVFNTMTDTFQVSESSLFTIGNFSNNKIRFHHVVTFLFECDRYSRGIMVWLANWIYAINYIHCWESRFGRWSLWLKWLIFRLVAWEESMIPAFLSLYTSFGSDWMNLSNLWSDPYCYLVAFDFFDFLRLERQPMLDDFRALQLYCVSKRGFELYSILNRHSKFH
jgi:hypothetical protein